MPHIKLTARARADLGRLHAFLAELDPSAAERAINAIIESFSTLQKMPLIGSPVVDRKGLRKLVIDFGDTGYTALYSLNEKTDTLQVLAIKHQKENDYK